MSRATSPSIPASSVRLTAVVATMSMGSEHLSQGAGESGQYALTVRFVGLADDSDRSIRAMNSSQASIGVYHPDELGTGFQPVCHLLADFARSIVGRQHLHREVGSESRITAWHWFRNSIAQNEAYIGSANGVG